MPTSASASCPSVPSPATSSAASHRSDLLARLASPDYGVKLKALRELKNRIIGNRTKKLSYVNLGLVPAVAAVLSSADPNLSDLLIQSAAVLGSFACGFDAGVRAVLDAGVFPCLVGLLSHRDEKVVDAGARSLKMIYQSKFTPKYDFLQPKNMDFLVSLLNSENENVTGLGAGIVIHSCEAASEQTALCQAGVLKKLIALLEGSLNQREASLESIATVIKNNAEAVSEFAGFENGRAMSSVVTLTKDRYLRTRLLAATCLIAIRNTCPVYLQDFGMKTKLVDLLLDLQEDPEQVGDEAAFVFSDLITGKEDLQKIAYEADAVNILYRHLEKDEGLFIAPKRAEGLFLAMADLCSNLECCRTKCLSLKVVELVIDALTHDSSGVRTAACNCLRSVARSIKCLCAGEFMNETILLPLVELLQDNCTSVQVAALSALCNIVVDFNKRKYILERCGGVKRLVQLSTSMDSALRLNSVWVLRNLVFCADKSFKENIFRDLTPSSLASLICDSESSVQEQALLLLCNLVNGHPECIEFIFAEDGILLEAVIKQLQNASQTNIWIHVHGMYVLCNVSSGKEIHMDAITHQLVRQADSGTQSFVIKFLQSSEPKLRTATVWTIVNITLTDFNGASDRVAKLRNAGIVSQLKNMNCDPCPETKLRVRTALSQILSFGDGLLQSRFTSSHDP